MRTVAKKNLFRTLARACACLLLSAATVAADARATTYQLDIPAQSLDDALQALALASQHKLFYDAALVRGKTSPALKGQFTTEEAVRRLLSGTNLRYELTDDGLLMIRPSAVAPATPSSAPTAAARNNWLRLAQSDARFPAPDGSPQSSPRTAELEEVVVTGTQIAGAEPSSPVLTITQTEMRLSGHANLGEAVRALPQNFSGGQNPGIAIGATGGNANYTGSSSLNLRGLGADATLTLLNGTRMPYDGNIQATDVSVIPVAAIDRVEILLDGASAIYGSDAVAGVANILLKRDYEGVDVSARYGVATDGGFEQQQYNVTGGTTWSSGGVLATADFSKNTPVYARQRDYLASLPNQAVTLYPRFEQQSTLLSGHQKLGDIAELTFDAFYTDRDTRDLGQTTAVFDNQRDAVIWGIAPAVRFKLPGEWSLRMQGARGRNDHTNRFRGFAVGTGVELRAASPITKYVNEAETYGAGAEGPLFDLAGGEARVSLGGGYRKSEFDQIAVMAGTRVVSGATQSHHAYGEINLPFVEKLTVNGAVRYESYETFGDVTTPKIGAIWKPLPELHFKASWGKSFKAPTLNQLYQAQALYLYPSSLIPALPAGTTVLYAGGGNSALDPERAEVISAGFVARPTFLPGFSVEVGWFDIDYTERVVTPVANLSQVGSNPAYADSVILSPSVAQQNAAFEAMRFPVGTFTSNAAGRPYNPANISAIVNNSFANATGDRLTGVDLSAVYRMDLGSGRLAFTTNGSWIDRTRQLTTRAPEFDAAGAIFFPAKFKGRFGTQWSDRGLTLTAHVNYIDGVDNTNLAARPKGGSMTTLDLIADYRIERGFLGGVGLNVAAINLLDRAPPYMQASQAFFPPYDSTNYSALGRTVSATLTKQF